MARTPIFIEVKDSAGNVVPAASVNIKRRQNGADATLYNAETAGSVIANPQTADSLGRVSVWVDRGDYNAIVTGTGISAYTVPIDAGPSGDAEIDVSWLPASVQSLVSGGNTTTIQTGGTLPASPINGDEVVYTADATLGVTWRFKYRSASASTYKWEFIGGGFLFNSKGVNSDASTASNSYTDLSDGAGPALTVPLAGDYDIEWTVGGSFNGYMGIQIGATAADDDNAVISTTGYATNATMRRKTVTAASTTITAKYRANTGSFLGRVRTLRIIPVRVA